MNAARIGSAPIPDEARTRDRPRSSAAGARTHCGGPGRRSTRGGRDRRRSSPRRCRGSAAAPEVGTDRRLEAVALDRLGDRRALAARDDQRVEPGEILGIADLARVGAELGEHAEVGGEVALAGQDSDARRSADAAGTTSRAAAAAPLRRRARRCRRPASGRRDPSKRRARARGPRSGLSPRRRALAVRSGSADLKMPEPTKLPSAPSCIVSDASAGVAIPPAQNSGTGSQPRSATSRTTSSGARRLLRLGGELHGVERLRACGSRR